jgi:hypothetical protein
MIGMLRHKRVDFLHACISKAVFHTDYGEDFESFAAEMGM